VRRTTGPTSPIDGERLLTDLTAIAEQIALKEEYEAYQQTHQREFAPDWYDWQRDHFRAGKDHTERMVLAGNQTGKSLSGGYETALHLTGRYPIWWDGLVLRGPITGWALGVDAQQLRDVIQHQLIGELDENHRFTGGWIHPDEIGKVERSNAAPGLMRDIAVKHLSGRWSKLSLRSFTQTATGQKSLSFAGSKVDWLWVDETPPDSLRGQLMARTTMGNYGKGGKVLYTMTPELGLTQLVHQFMSERRKSQYLTGPVAWEQCPHITPDRREELLAAFPPHERDMRSKGLPLFGEGLVYPVSEARLMIEMQETPAWHKRIRAMDLGGNDSHTAIVWLSMNPESGEVRLKRAYKEVGVQAAVHAQAANSMWADTPLVMPPDIMNHEKGTMVQIIDYYKQAGIKRPLVFHNPGKHGEMNRHVEPGIFALLQAMQEDRFKVELNCTGSVPWLNEIRAYHRDGGKIVRKMCDLMDATRYGFQMIAKYGVRANARGLKTRVVGAVEAFAPFRG
jgi:phage terminase large subunit-like protein